ncbi:MAG TPA: AMP-binding protein, partial [Thermodesulfobacteriota bacterium]|nr:AMP-binding protein [Thermodesulfobacteriota bacterium]
MEDQAGGDAVNERESLFRRLSAACGGHTAAAGEPLPDGAPTAPEGDRVALFLDNSEEMVASIFAVLQVGAVFMPVNTLTKADKLAYMLNDAQASGLITQTALAAVAHQALAQAPSVHTCWMVGGDTALEHRYALETPYPA